MIHLLFHRVVGTRSKAKYFGARLFGTIGHCMPAREMPATAARHTVQRAMGSKAGAAALLADV
jgi:hypothetical protein